jgi:hypothetical protein
LIDVRKREPTPELVPERRGQRIQHEGEEIPVRRKDRLSPDVARHGGSQDGQSTDLSSHVPGGPAPCYTAGLDGTLPR